MNQTLTNSKTPINWPFKFFNGVQTQESKDLESSKFKKTPLKEVIQDMEEALF